MIIGTITLITILFLGGTPDYFLVKNLDKGIKQYVDDKERKKGLLAAFKVEKKNLKETFKLRKSYIKEIEKINANRKAIRADLHSYGDSLMRNAMDYQVALLNARLNLIGQIEDDEWDSIVAMSEEVTKKEKDKLKEKIEKGKVKHPFTNLEATIKSVIDDGQKKADVLESMAAFKEQFNVLANKLSEKNVADLPTIRNKYASREELMAMAEVVNSIKVETFQHYLDFRLDLVNNTNEMQWDKIIKEINKLWL